MQEVSGDDRVRRVRLRIEHRAPRRHGITFVRPQPREPEVKLHDCDARVELGELLEPVERARRATTARAAPTFASSESCLANRAAAAAVSPLA